MEDFVGESRPLHARLALKDGFFSVLLRADPNQKGESSTLKYGVASIFARGRESIHEGDDKENGGGIQGSQVLDMVYLELTHLDPLTEFGL